MIRIITACLLALTIAACTGTAGLAPALTARMDAPGARLDRGAAINIINQFRVSRGADQLSLDETLNDTAQKLAALYATSGSTPDRPDNAGIILTSAGYATLADTFSGWRNGGKDADELANTVHKRAGIGVAYTANSNFGVYWVMLLAPDPKLNQ